MLKQAVKSILTVVIILLPILALSVTPENYVHRGRGTVNASMIRQLKRQDCNKRLSEEAKPFEVGSEVYIEWHGGWYLATVLKTNYGNQKYYIHYTGWSNSWNEWVGLSRIIHRTCK